MQKSSMRKKELEVGVQEANDFDGVKHRPEIEELSCLACTVFMFKRSLDIDNNLINVL